MSYTTTTSSRRQIGAKAKPGQRQAKPPAAFRDSERAATKAAVPELFNRSVYRRPVVAAPTPWWKTWLVVTLSNVVALAVFAGIYAWSQSQGPASEQRRYSASAHVASQPPAVVNIRPMGFSSSRQSMPVTTRQASAGSTDRGALSGDPAAVEQALSDGSRKLVLPANVAGNCSIGESGSKDFGRCLVQNGARAE